MIITHTMDMCRAQELATNSQGQGHNLPWSRSQLGLKHDQKLLHSESRVRAVSPTTVDQILYNFT